MKKQALNRMYNFPDADLYVMCLDCIRNAYRDETLFKQYGYAPERTLAFKSQCEKFKALPDDDELIGEQMLATEKKYGAAENLKTAIRSIMTRVEMKFNSRSGRYRKFGTAKMGDMTDAQLLFCGRRVVRVSQMQMAFFESVGLNELAIQRVSQACAEFESCMNVQQDKVSDRDIAVEIRTEQGNKIYEELVVLCNIGKDVWADKDPKRYELYCVYESNNDQKIARKAKLKAEEAKKKEKSVDEEAVSL
ncbi:MAG: hypothetical protein RLZZ628_2633 [Bacteroidota bacterium]|jgi:hypothetical protein